MKEPVEIEGVWYKHIDRKDYKVYVQECKNLGVSPKFIVNKGAVVYQIFDSKELLLLNSNKVKPDLTINVSKIKLFDIKGDVISDLKPAVPETRTVIKKGFFPHLSAPSSLYQYCDSCSTETNHFKSVGYIICSRCKKGYMSVIELV